MMNTCNMLYRCFITGLEYAGRLLASHAYIINFYFPGTNIAFYAILVDDTTLSYRMSLIFDSSRTNNGNAYDPRTGIFKCPVTGTYSFSLNIACSSGNYLEASIMKGNNVPLFNSICKNLDATGIHQNGGSAVVKLIKGDLISVKMIWPGDTLATVKGRGLSSFSGFLLNSST